MQHLRFVLAVATLCLLLPESALAVPQNIMEVQTLEFYEGISVTSMRFANGNFTALVSDPAAGRGLDKDGSQSHHVDARYDLRVSARMGSWKVFDPGSNSAVEHVFDYRATSNTEFLSRLDGIMADHTVESVALSALLLYEEHLYEADKVFQDFKSMTGFQSFDKQQTEVCDGCTASFGGCSPSWIVPQSCGGLVLTPMCLTHDSCYQCGAFCSGASRLECDRAFRDAIAGGGSPVCAEIYYWGVRALGWHFYQDPNARPYMGPDVYAMGIQMSPCEGQYAHMCTTYVM